MNVLGALLQQTDVDTTANAVGISVGVIVWLGFMALFLVGYWKVFTKIGLPGWMGIIPFVNVYMLFKARGERDPVVWLILSLIPCINIIAMWFLANDTAELFDKEIGWKLFLFFIPGISHLVLGFGESQVNPLKVAPGVGMNEVPRPQV